MDLLDRYMTAMLDFFDANADKSILPLEGKDQAAVEPEKAKLIAYAPHLPTIMSFRSEHETSWRAGDVLHTIDPGFVHFRKIETIIGSSGMKVIDDLIGNLPELPEWQRPALTTGSQ